VLIFIPRLNQCTTCNWYLEHILRGCLTYQNYNHYCSADASLLEAIGMFDLGLGVSHVSDILPLPVCALLSLLNPSVVGVTPFAAVQLTEKPSLISFPDSWSFSLRVQAYATMCYGIFQS
jgi:hypothetical protein